MGDPVLKWIRQLFGDPNGNHHESVEAFKQQRQRSSEVKTDMEDVAAQLKASREAVHAKAHAIQEEDRVSQEGLPPAQEAAV
jgi:hypothetical protein